MSWSGIKSFLLKASRVRAAEGGLEISSAEVRFALQTEGGWEFRAVRLEPGVIAEGKVVNRAAFLAALQSLKDEALGGPARTKKLNAVVSLASSNVYMQVFTLPMIEGERLEDAIRLNIQMVSPAAAAETYAGWQLVGRDDRLVRLEILSMFAERSVVEGITSALEEVGIVPYAVESRALSLARLVRERGAGTDPKKSYVLLVAGNDGMEFLVLRNNQVYFEYHAPWQDIQGGEREVSQAAFASAIIRSLHQVLNFYTSHWSDPVSEVLLVAPEVGEQVKSVVGANFAIPVRELVLAGESVAVEWYVALGAGLRTLLARRDDREASVLGVSAEEDFRRHQVMSFLSFWRVVVPVALLLLTAGFFSADIYFIRAYRAIRAGSPVSVGSEEAREIVALREAAERFNRSVSLLDAAIGGEAKSALLQTLQEIFASHGAVLRHVSFQGTSLPVALTGEARSEEQILAVKKALEADARFESVNVPLADIRPGGQGLYFSISFFLRSSNTP